MAAFPARDKDDFMSHWKIKILAVENNFKKTIIFNGHIAGNLLCWEQDGKWLVGYWIGQEYWGRGIATSALKEFLQFFNIRPLYAYVSKNNIGSIRVLEKCGFTTENDEKSFSKVHGHDVEEVLMVCKF
jgi:RimJ/RimL family protein N-acetyltransferase